MKRLLVICGPTATGKTSLGVFLAKKLRGEIVSFDSRQIFRGMDIGTGKDLPSKSQFNDRSQVLGIKDQSFQAGYYFFKGIPVWLLDIVKPDCRFSAADYARLAPKVIKDIWRRKRLPILVGGTGFYLQALIEGIGTMGIKPDWDLRKKLARLSAAELAQRLKAVDFKKFRKMNRSDQRNPRRLVRAIEIARAKESAAPLALKAAILKIGLTASNQDLYFRIDRRVKKRVEQGVEAEIKSLLNQGFDWRNSALGTTLGYQEWEDYFKKKATRKTAIQRWQFGEHRYARRQKTWFKRDAAINWFEITKVNCRSGVAKLIKDWYIKKETENAGKD